MCCTASMPAHAGAATACAERGASGACARDPRCSQTAPRPLPPLRPPQEVIAINQDPLGVPGDLVWQQGPKMARIIARVQWVAGRCGPCPGGGHAGVPAPSCSQLSTRPPACRCLRRRWPAAAAPWCSSTATRCCRRRGCWGQGAGPHPPCVPRCARASHQPATPPTEAAARHPALHPRWPPPCPPLIPSLCPLRAVPGQQLHGALAPAGLRARDARRRARPVRRARPGRV